MVEISKSGSGEGPGKVTTRGYSTAHVRSGCDPAWWWKVAVSDVIG
jgi:hypothetical protein